MLKKILIGTGIIFFVLILFLFVFQPINSVQDMHTTPELSITDAQDREIMHFINNHRTTPIEIEKMSQKNIDILLTIEDKTFYQHSGFNLSRILKTLASNLKKNQSHGASTITQQYVKNVYLDNSKTFGRKFKELYYAIKLEQIASKDEILASYLNCIYLGNDIYGIANASSYYFNKSYTDLSIKEMTTFVALLNAPTYYSTHLDKLEEKKNRLLTVLLENNTITSKEYEQAKTPIEFHLNPYIYNSNLLYFTDGVLKEYKAMNLNPKFNQKVTIKTQYNMAMNTLAVTSPANYASIAVNKDGFILAMIGDKDYYTSSFNITVNGKRDIGSTIKPLLYYEALKCGYSTKQTYYSGPYSFSYHNETITIKNNASVYPYKDISMREALATSDNIYAIKTHQALGFKTLSNHLKKYNIEAKSLPSLALGSVGMSLQDLTRIYTQFFTEGKYLKLRYIEQIHIDNKKHYQAKTEYKSLGSSEDFKKIKDLMSSIFDSSIPHSTAASIASKLPTKCYGKSGLTDFDSYMMGFSDDILIGVWSGYLDNQPLEDITSKRIPKEIFLKLINSYYGKPS